MNIARRYQASEELKRSIHRIEAARAKGAREADRLLEALDKSTGPSTVRVVGRPPSGKAKTAISLRVDPDVLDYFKSTGEGWQTRMNDALRKAAGL
jgi:uncharacterized protein (DUF4415 family)